MEIDKIFEQILACEKALSQIDVQRVTVNTELDLQAAEWRKKLDRAWQEIADEMKETGEFEVLLPYQHAKIYYTTPRQSVKVDEDAVPDEYCKIVRKPKLAEIKKLLESGVSLNWARMESGEPKLTYRYLKG